MTKIAQHVPPSSRSGRSGEAMTSSVASPYRLDEDDHPASERERKARVKHPEAYARQDEFTAFFNRANAERNLHWLTEGEPPC